MDVPTLMHNLKEEVTCSVCLHLYKEPKQLPCLHIFCLECLNDLVRTSTRHGKIKCPLCQTEVTVPGSGTMETLPDCFYLKNLLDVLAIRECSTSKVTCGNCDTKSEEASYCFHCCKFWCKECLNGHNILKENKEHRVLALKDFQDKDFEDVLKRPAFCPKELHEKGVFKFYCKVCKVPACQTCVTLEHSKHDVEHLEIVARKVKNSVASKLDTAKRSCEIMSSCVRDLDEQIRVTEHRSQIVKGQIQQTFKSIFLTLQEKERELVTEVENQTKEALENFTSDKAKIEDQLKKGEETIAHVEHLVGRSTGAELVQADSYLSELFQGLPSTPDVMASPGEGRSLATVFSENRAFLQNLETLCIGRVSKTPTQPSRCTVEGFNGEATTGLETRFELITRRFDGEQCYCPADQIAVEVVSVEGGALAVDMRDRNNGRYEVSCIPKLPGEHRIAVLINKQELSNLPSIQVKKRSFKPVKCIGAESINSKNLSHPWGLTVSNSNEIFISDMDNNRILVLNEDGDFVRSFGQHTVNLPNGLITDNAGSRSRTRSLGEAGHEGWLAKKGGPLFFSSWKRKWVVLKEGKLYYFKTAFDPEASGIINMEGTTVAQAPETKKNFCFKCEQPGPKPQVSIFMADSKEDMDKWLTLLGAASRGETIHKTKQHHLTPRDEAVMRKKSGSISAQRTSSVLAVGGRHDFLEDEEDLKAIRRRSTPGSLSKSHIETEEEDKQPSVSSDTHPVVSDTQPVPSDTQPEPPQESQEETEKSGEGETAEKPVPVVDEVLESSNQVVVESAAPAEVAPSEQETPAAEKSDDAVPEVASQQEGKGSEEPANVSVEVMAETESTQPEQQPAADASDSTVDKTDGALSVVTTESSVTVVETVKTTSVVSEKVETVVSVVKTEVTEVNSAPQPPEEKVETAVSVVKTEVTEVSSAQQPPEELKHDVKEDVKKVSPTKPDASTPLPSEPTSPSKTKWYFTLDQQETWSVPPEVEGEKSSSRQKLSSSSSDKGSIKSGKGSIKSASDDDLLIMCRNIREARLSIVGDHVWEGAERLRALSSVHDDNEEAFVRLKTLERTLKDKEKHLSELEELLTQPEINRESIYAWKLRYSDLVEELLPQDAEDAQEKSAENAAEGGEGETQDQKHSEAVKEDEKLQSSEAEGSEKEVKDETSEEVKEETSEEVKDSPEEVKEEIPTEVGKKSDEEVATSFKEEDEGKMDDKQDTPERKEKHEKDQEIIKEEQPSSEKQEETKVIENDNLAVIVQTEQIPVGSAPVADSEQNVLEAETIHEGEISRQNPLRVRK